MNFRRAYPSEAQALEDMLMAIHGDTHRVLAHGYVTSMFSDDFRRPIFIVCEEGGTLIGTAAYSEELFTVKLWGISWVGGLPEWRGKGLGRKLVEACLAEIAAQISTPVTVLLDSYPDMTVMYEGAGFTTHGPCDETRCLMSRVLQPANSSPA